MILANHLSVDACPGHFDQEEHLTKLIFVSCAERLIDRIKEAELNDRIVQFGFYIMHKLKRVTSVVPSPF
ncbi:hypothetical protein MUN89_14745 [Halobacillus salinarum]|uniref:Uncharacterized protein n=1 Tax=Halobacillus salinarum TaxID=2932257 RepID=A0ABY4EGB7_9BACI|nr:hypothetical protein [Halobacillus salinarum]UOQ43186.1 hypothetical protein MUN89_14745 [Halobacillus salinarum]